LLLQQPIGSGGAAGAIRISDQGAVREMRGSRVPRYKGIVAPILPPTLLYHLVLCPIVAGYHCPGTAIPPSMPLQGFNHLPHPVPTLPPSRSLISGVQLGVDRSLFMSGFAPAAILLYNCRCDACRCISASSIMPFMRNPSVTLPWV